VNLKERRSRKKARECYFCLATYVNDCFLTLFNLSMLNLSFPTTRFTKIRTRLLFSLLFTVFCFSAVIVWAQGTGTRQPLRIIAFGAHPDDAELKASGVAALWAAQGHKVKFVSMTNGDIGHFQEAGGPLAIRRRAEVEECARLLGIETEVMDIHDGELEPTLENRKKVARLIRNWQADIVLFHRPNDYHADHRYVGVLVEDAAVLVAAPFFTPDTPPTKRNPVFMYYSDNFLKPNPFEPTIVVGIDEVAQQKWNCVSAMPSQFGDEFSWQASTLPNIPRDEKARKEYLLNLFMQRNVDVADKYRNRLVELYGKDRGRKFKYAEAFELCQYGRQPSLDELKQLFPTFK
jgi:N-acetylglucosamine malate deacetylase 1